MIKIYPLVLAAMVLLAGCESMSKQECQVADWQRVGFNDGASGQSERRLAAYTEDCGEAGVKPDAEAYRRGWDSGILRFCTAANGWREGVQGHSGKNAVCQAQPGYETFTRYLEAGMQVYRTQEQMRQNDYEINRLQKRLEAGGSDEEKKRIREALRDLDRQQFYLRATLAQQQMLAPR
ncbi:MAG: DUF2799 domain-containing protein [Rhodoferax sp.]|nr:DUF2799 domain-containing protein [Rhodoferax sp.]